MKRLLTFAILIITNSVFAQSNSKDVVMYREDAIEQSFISKYYDELRTFNYNNGITDSVQEKFFSIIK